MPYRLDCDFHGLNLSADGNVPRVMNAVRSRLRHFPPVDGGPRDLVFRFEEVVSVSNDGDSRPPSEARPVYESESGKVTYDPRSDRFEVECGNLARVVSFPARGEARIAFRAESSEAEWLASHPLFTLPLLELLKRRGMFGIHAASLSNGGRAVLVAGASGSGKTTMSLALMRAGFGFLADDLCFLGMAEDGLRILAFPDELDVTDDTLRLFPELEHVPTGGRSFVTGKRSLLSEDAYPAGLVSESRPELLLFPEVMSVGRSRITEMNNSEALVALAPNVLLTEAASSQRHLDVLTRLVQDVPCYHLESGSDLGRIPALVEDLMGSIP